MSLEQNFSYGDIKEYTEFAFQVLREGCSWESRNSAV